MSGISAVDGNGRLLKCLEILQQIRSENLEPRLFWPRYLEALRLACLAEAGLVAVRGLKEDSSWQVISIAPPAYRANPLSQQLVGKLDLAAEVCGGEESILLEAEGAKRWVGVRLKAGTGSQLCLVG